MGVLAFAVKTHDIESLIDCLSGGTGAQTCMAVHSGVSEVSLPVIGVDVMDVAIEAVFKELSSIEFNEFLTIVFWLWFIFSKPRSISLTVLLFLLFSFLNLLLSRDLFK